MVLPEPPIIAPFAETVFPKPPPTVLVFAEQVLFAPPKRAACEPDATCVAAALDF